MAAAEPLMHRCAGELGPDPSRVVARLFLPGEELRAGQSRAGAVVARVLALPNTEVERIAVDLLRNFADRHRDYAKVLTDNASMVSAHLRTNTTMTGPRALVLGASFTSEYAVEGAALCNPSAVLHPDQSGLGPGQARVAMSLRAIGEGHLSSIGFATATIGPGARWRNEPRDRPVVPGVSTAASWRREHLRAVLADQAPIDELAYSVVSGLPDVFTAAVLQRALGSSTATWWPAEAPSAPWPCCANSSPRLTRSSFPRTSN